MTQTKPRDGEATQQRNPKQSKKAALEKMLTRQRGATIAQMHSALAWQPHTIRAEISRLRKRGVQIVLDREVTPPAYRVERNKR